MVAFVNTDWCCDRQHCENEGIELDDLSGYSGLNLWEQWRAWNAIKLLLIASRFTHYRHPTATANPMYAEACLTACARYNSNQSQ